MINTHLEVVRFTWGFPGGSVVKTLPAYAGATGLIIGLGRSLEKEAATHSSVLAWEMDRNAWQAIIHRATKGVGYN